MLRAILIVLLTASGCQTDRPESASKAAGALQAEMVDGFPLPAPAGTEVREVRNATTAQKPRHHADAEMEARVTGDVEAIAAFYGAQLEAHGLTVEATEHARVDDERPEAPTKKLIRIVGKSEKTQVHVILTPGQSGHKLQIAVVGPL